MSTIVVKDLTKEYPRSPYEELDGIPWLARLIDKVRALGAGKLGAYTPYPCGGDRGFLGAAGLDADALKAQIDAGKTDAEIVAWVKGQLAAEPQAQFEAYRQRARSPITDAEMKGYLEGAKAALAKERPDLDLGKADNFPRLICLEEGHPLQ